MKYKQVMEFTEEDYELLRIGLPDSPCIGCKNASSCCGCNLAETFGKVVDKFRENNIYEIANTIKCYYAYKDLELSYREEKLKYFNEIPNDIVVNVLYENDKKEKGNY